MRALEFPTRVLESIPSRFTIHLLLTMVGLAFASHCTLHWCLHTAQIQSVNLKVRIYVSVTGALLALESPCQSPLSWAAGLVVGCRHPFTGNTSCTGTSTDQSNVSQCAYSDNLSYLCGPQAASRMLQTADPILWHCDDFGHAAGHSLPYRVMSVTQKTV